MRAVYGNGSGIVALVLVAVVVLLADGCRRVVLDMPAMVPVPAGTCLMGDPWSEGYPDELPVHAVTLSAYEIGTCEVTNAEYAAVMNWALGREYIDGDPGSVRFNDVELLDLNARGCQISYDGAYFVETRDNCSMAHHPVVEVSWYGAVAYCNWLSEAHKLAPCYDLSTWTLADPDAGGYRLPTEAEWERAAGWDAAEDVHWRYGITSDVLSVVRATYAGVNPFGLYLYPHTTPVGYYPLQISPVGCHDMSGNVWEWVQDWYAYDYYTDCVPTVIDPAGPLSGNLRVQRGGGWSSDADDCRTANRRSDAPTDTRYYVGFRIAR